MLTTSDIRTFIDLQEFVDYIGELNARIELTQVYESSDFKRIGDPEPTMHRFYYSRMMELLSEMNQVYVNYSTNDDTVHEFINLVHALNSYEFHELGEGQLKYLKMDPYLDLIFEDPENVYYPCLDGEAMEPDEGFMDFMSILTERMHALYHTIHVYRPQENEVDLLQVLANRIIERVIMNGRYFIAPEHATAQIELLKIIERVIQSYSSDKLVASVITPNIICLTNIVATDLLRSTSYNFKTPF